MERMANEVQLDCIDDLLIYFAGYAAARRWTFDWRHLYAPSDSTFRFTFKDRCDGHTVGVMANVDSSVMSYIEVARQVLVDVEREMSSNVRVI